MKTLLPLVLMLLLYVQAGAQLSEEFDTILVTANQVPATIRETGRNVTIIRAEQIKKMPAVSIDEILQLVPGVEIQSRNGFGAQADILMRGSTFAQVLVLVDGVRLNDPLTAHFNGNIPVANDEIARIEVLRGPSAAMYGPDAVGGLINIVTKTFAGQNDQGLSGDVALGVGSHDQILAKGYLSSAGQKAKVSLGAQYTKSEGELISAIQKDDVSLDAYRNYFEVATIGASLVMPLSNQWNLKLRSSYDYRDFSARYFYTTSPFDKSTEITTNSFNLIKLEKLGGKSSSDLQIGYKYNTDEFVFSPDFPSTNHHKTNYINVLYNQLWEINGNFLIKSGLQIDRRAIKSNDRGDHQDGHAGIYMMGLWKPDESLNISSSLRADYDQNYDLEVLPQVNISYLLGNWVLRGSLGRSIRAADYTERYVSNNLAMLTPGRSLGNPDLLAESSWSEEIGIDIPLTTRWQMKATGFQRQSRQLIDYVLTNESEIGNIGDLQSGADYYFAKNISKVTTRGLELETTYRHRFGLDNLWQLMASYTHQQTVNEEGVVSVYIANHARDLATLSSLLDMGNFHFTVSGLYKNRNARVAQAINSELKAKYTLWNLKLGYNLTKDLLLDIQVQNLFNEKYQNILGAPMPGRWFSVTIGWDF
ncbi:MAG: TonB-dependent receptor [Saprospiraceae bacterium]|nr:TonB-dependent receptor [Saprospiraceae bacterium]